MTRYLLFGFRECKEKLTSQTFLWHSLSEADLGPNGPSYASIYLKCQEDESHHKPGQCYTLRDKKHISSWCFPQALGCGQETVTAPSVLITEGRMG